MAKINIEFTSLVGQVDKEELEKAMRECLFSSSELNIWNNGYNQAIEDAVREAEEKARASISIKYYSEFVCFADELLKLKKEAGE